MSSLWAVWQMEKTDYLSQASSESTVIKPLLEMTTNKKDSEPIKSPFE